MPGGAASGDPLLGFGDQGVAAGGGIGDAAAQQGQIAALAAGGLTGGGEAERGTGGCALAGNCLSGR